MENAVHCSRAMVSARFKVGDYVRCKASDTIVGEEWFLL